MNSDLQRAAIAMLAEVWALSPDVRLGQLLAHLGFLGEDRFERGLGDIEDDELMSVLSGHRVELLARLQNAPESLLRPSEGAVTAGQSSTASGGG